MNIDPSIVADAIRNDHTFSFKETAEYFYQGTCPDCNKKSVSIGKSKPYRLWCNHTNHCGYEETTRNLYPELWASLTKLAPATAQDPKATARYYLQNVRGFNTLKIENLYSQELRTIKALNGESINVVVCRFPLWGNNYQDRVINQVDIERIDPSKKAPFNYGFKYKGKAWVEPSLQLKTGDSCFLVEGIFHAIALLEVGQNAIASFSSNNYPAEFIEQHKNLNINWVLGYDDDKAGHKAINKFKKLLKAKGQRYQVALTGGEKDWDDVLKEGKLDNNFIDDCLWRGDVFNAKSVAEKAYHLFRKQNKAAFLTDFKNRTYQCFIEIKDINDALDSIAEIDDSTNLSGKEIATKRHESLLTTEGKNTFIHDLKVWPIAQCHPIFLYSENEKLTHEITYYFEVHTPSLTPKQVPLSGGAIESASSFNKALLSRVAGATFEGDAKQLKAIRENWFANGIDEIQTVPFIGYDKESGFYLFPNFAYKGGRKIPVNKHNYIKEGKHKLKTTFKAFPVVQGKPFAPHWFNDYAVTFDDNGLVVLAHWLGSLFAEQIRAKHASYPFLEMSGMPGTGKSTVLEFLWKCTGRDDYEGFDPSKATFSGRAKTFIQAANLPVVLIEADREKDINKKGGFDYNELKTAYNGRAVRTMGAFSRGNETVEPPFRGSIVLAQNAEIDADPAVLERIIHLEFTKSHFTPKTKQLSKKLENTDCEDLAGFFQEVLSKEKEILHEFFHQFDHIERRYVSNGKLKNGRIVKNHAQIAALFHCLKILFPQITPQTEQRITDFIEQRGEQRERRLISDHPLVQQFWETYDLLEGNPSSLVNHSRKENHIAINLPDFLRECAVNRYEMPNQQQLKPLLKTSVKRKFLGNKPVMSCIRDTTTKCWVFEREK